MPSRIATFAGSLLRFRLRTLLIVVLVFGVAMGVYVNRVKRQQESVAAVARLGGWVHYDYQLDDNGYYDPKGESWAPSWLRKRLTDDYFHPVVEINMVYNDDHGGRLENSTNTDEVLSHLEGLPRLERLLLHDSQVSDKGLANVGKLSRLKTLLMWDAHGVTDAGVAHLAGCRNLEQLHLSESKVGDEGLRVLSKLPRLEGMSLQANQCTDEGLAHVAQMRQLTTLWIGCTAGRNDKITDAGLAHLAKLPRLETLDLQHTGVTNDGLDLLAETKTLRNLYLSGSAANDATRLQAALPKCKIDLPAVSPPLSPPPRGGGGIF